jgi:hypothetical protein
MKVSLTEFNKLQRFVYDGHFESNYIPIYTEFTDFCRTSYVNPKYSKLVEGLINIEVS